MGRSRESTYLDKVYGGWMGKNIGGTLGGPVEGRMEVLDLHFYPDLSTIPLPNDDLDLQLVNLHAMEQYGVALGTVEIGQEWLNHVFFPYDEYGCRLANLRRGLRPPVAGWFNNPFTHCMGSPIRSELWAMVCPGRPRLAAHFAVQDGMVDHAGGEGVYGEMFFAALESAAFLTCDKELLIKSGLETIPADCRTYRAVSDLLVWYGAGMPWTEARREILQKHGNDNFTDAPQNIAFTVLGLLYGEDFEEALLTATNCGYDTDCTAATLGAILGIIQGCAALPSKWTEPVGDMVALIAPIKGFDPPATLLELTGRTYRIAREVAAVWDTGVCFSKSAEISDPKDHLGDLRVGEVPALPDICTDYFTVPQGSCRKQSLAVTVHYGGDGPSIGANCKKNMTIQVRNYSSESWDLCLSLRLPDGWRMIGKEQVIETLAPEEAAAWEVKIQSNSHVHISSQLAIVIRRNHDGHVWNEYEIPFTLVPASRWIVRGPENGEEVELFSPGNRITFEDALDMRVAGDYTAKPPCIARQKDKSG